MNEQGEPNPKSINVNYGLVSGDLLQIGYATVRMSANVERHEPHELLPDALDFVGRAAALSAMDEMLAQQRENAPVVVALSGMGGVGKTTLAVHWSSRVAQQFPDGQIYLDLNGNGPGRPMEPMAALGALLRSLGTQDTEIADSAEERSRDLRTLLSHREMVIILDNAATAAQVRKLLPGPSRNFMIITSRDQLNGLSIRGSARPLHLDVFTPDESTELLERLQAGSPKAESAALAELAQLCGHLPLALRIAAQTISGRDDLGAADLVTALKEADQSRLDHFNVAGDPQTALRTVLSYSYEHLTYNQARIFRIVAALPTRSADAHAVAAAADCGLSAARTTLAELCSASLLDPLGIDRVRIHDLMREFAREINSWHQSPEERAAMESRVVAYYRDTSLSAVNSSFPTDTRRLPYELNSTTRTFQDRATAKRWLDEELPNLSLVVHTAKTNGHLEATIQLSLVLHSYLYSTAHCTEAMAIHECALAVAEGLEDSAAAVWIMKNIGTTQWRLGRLHTARQWYTRALALTDHVADMAVTADIHNNLGNVNDRLGEFEAALSAHQAALKLRERLGDREAQGASHNNIGLVYWRLGRMPQALASIEQALAIAVETHDLQGEGDARSNLGILYAKLGRRQEAIEAYEIAARLSRQLDDPAGESITLNNHGNLLRKLGKYPEALAHYQAALQICEHTKDLANGAMVKTNLARAHARLGERAQCMHYLLEALSESREVGDRANEGESLNAFGEAYAVFDEPQLALEHYRLALAVGRGLGEKDIVCEALNGAGTSMLSLGEGSARDHFAESLDIARATENMLEQANALLGLSECARLAEYLPEARELAKQSLRLFEQFGSPEATIVNQRIASLRLEPGN